MHIRAVIPFKPENPKTRLSPLFDQDGRSVFARAMLDDVVGAVIEAGCDPLILATSPMEYRKAAVEVREEGLNEVLNDLLTGMRDPLLVIMADLPLVTGEAVRRVCTSESDVALVPGRGGGTNAIFMREPFRFRADFYGASFLDHIRIARERGLKTEVIDSFLLSTDIDEPDDLVEVLIHGRGKSRSFLESAGFKIDISNGRVRIKREERPHEEAF
ncbi:MAG: 2-phospho-L-lactate guanylyltransferase [Methanoculleaceae archaeon]